ncbi:MAG: DNA-directed RNA polymerase sigma-70 factor [Chloroflexota bacterium]|nr:MAG: DNA-directed RNA polymerase sigma-70 factor [Chloroflexota bacterium]
MSEPSLSRVGSEPVSDRAALAAAYDQYHLPIYRYIYRQVGEVETARDLAAETFRHLLTAAKQGHGPRDNLKAWLYQTAHHLVIDYYRRQKHRNHLPLAEDLIDLGDDPVRSAEGHLTAEQVRAALHSLTPEQQQVIVLKYLEGLSNAEVAEITGKPVGAVKSLQHRALVALRTELTRKQEKVFL